MRTLNESPETTWTMLSNSQLPESRSDMPAGDGSISTEPIATSTRHEPAIAAADPIATRAAMPTAATASRDRIDGERFSSGAGGLSKRPDERAETFAEVSGAAETALSIGT